MRYILLFFSILFLLSSCKKDPLPLPDIRGHWIPVVRQDSNLMCLEIAGPTSGWAHFDCNAGIAFWSELQQTQDSVIFRVNAFNIYYRYQYELVDEDTLVLNGDQFYKD